MKIHLFILSIIFICHSSFGQNSFDADKISSEVMEIVDSLTDISTLHLVDCWNDRKGVNEYDNYKQLEIKASVTELFQLINHSKCNIRCYSFFILSKTESIDLFPIVVDHFNDTSCINIINSCVLDGSYYSCFTVSDFFIDVVTKEHYQETTKLDSVQMTFIDSLLIYSPVVKLSRHNALKRQEPIPERYDRIKEIYNSENNIGALLAIAKYQKKDDISVILKAQDKISKHFVFEAISYFPDQAFIPFLKEELDAFSFGVNYEQNFYLAIASYKNKQAEGFLSTILEKLLEEDNNKYRLRKLLLAIQSNIDDIYIDIMYELWKDAYITPDIFNFLNEKDSNKAFIYSKTSLTDSIKLNQYLGGIYDRKTDALLDLMLGLIVQKDTPFAIELINVNIKEPHVLMFQAFAKYALLLKEKVFIEPLLEVVQYNTFERNCRAAAESLIAYNDTEINNELIVIMNLRTGTQEGEEIKKVLIEHNLN